MWRVAGSSAPTFDVARTMAEKYRVPPWGVQPKVLVRRLYALRRQAMQEGLRPLRLAGAMKVAEGLTTIEEVLRSTPAWEA